MAIGLEPKPPASTIETKELRELIEKINQEAGKIVWASLEADTWRRAGFPNHRGGQNLATTGKNLKGFDPTNRDSERSLEKYIESDKLGAPERSVFGKDVYREYITYRLQPLHEGGRQSLMEDKVETGDKQEAFLLAFKRACIELKFGRGASTDLALILPKELALKTFQFLQSNPKMADELFEQTLPTWIREASSEIKFVPSQHVHGEAL